MVRAIEFFFLLKIAYLSIFDKVYERLRLIYNHNKLPRSYNWVDLIFSGGFVEVEANKSKEKLEGI